MAEINQNQEAENNKQELIEVSSNIIEGDKYPETTGLTESAEQKKPEEKIEISAGIIEKIDKSDSILGSEWMQNAKIFIKKGAAVGWAASKVSLEDGSYLLGRLFVYVFRTIKSALNVVGKAAEQAGGKPKSLFSEGSKIGEEIFKEDKKEKKGE